MSQRDDHWGDEDEKIARRLREDKPRLGAFELDRIKTTVMARVKPARGRRTAPRSRLLVAFMTVGLMVAGTAGTIAASNTSFSGSTGAAQSQYRPPKCNPMHEECKCPGGSVRTGRNQCTCPPGESFGERTNDCLCPNGKHPNDDGKCRRHRDAPSDSSTSTGSARTAGATTHAPSSNTSRTITTRSRRAAVRKTARSHRRS